jgi:Protein of unknown function (DUF4236)
MWRFRKSFSPLPGVRLTLSPSGISTSVGVGPFRVTAGPRGQHFTATIPGTGLSFRQTLSGGQARRGEAESPQEMPRFSPEAVQPLAAVSIAEQIESAGSAVLTTPGIAEFRRLLDLARTEHTHTASELAAAIASERVATGKYLGWKSGWLFRRLMKSRFAELGAAAEESTARRGELEEQEELARLATQIEIPDSLKAIFARFSDAFVQLASSNKIWDTVSHRAVNQVAERTLAARAIERRSVRFGLGRCTVIQSNWQVPHLENANGGDIYLFPLFVVYFAGEHSFALLEYKDVQFICGAARFHEEEGVPSDSQVIAKTWAKTNKDGSPDRRFKENYEIPVAEYGRLVLQSSTGLNEEYLVSNVSSCQAFAKEWNAVIQGIARGA